MPVLTLEPGSQKMDVPRGTNLMKAIIQAKRPIGSSCGAAAVCAKCIVRILQGAENLSEPSAHERFLFDRDSIPSGHRVSCQARVLGDVTVTAGYW